MRGAPPDKCYLESHIIALRSSLNTPKTKTEKAGLQAPKVPLPITAPKMHNMHTDESSRAPNLRKTHFSRTKGLIILPTRLKCAPWLQFSSKVPQTHQFFHFSRITTHQMSRVMQFTTQLSLTNFNLTSQSLGSPSLFGTSYYQHITIYHPDSHQPQNPR